MSTSRWDLQPAVMGHMSPEMVLEDRAEAIGKAELAAALGVDRKTLYRLLQGSIDQWRIGLLRRLARIERHDLRTDYVGAVVRQMASEAAEDDTRPLLIQDEARSLMGAQSQLLAELAQQPQVVSPRDEEARGHYDRMVRVRRREARAWRQYLTAYAAALGLPSTWRLIEAVVLIALLIGGSLIAHPVARPSRTGRRTEDMGVLSWA